jgi:hypothetical protein
MGPLKENRTTDYADCTDGKGEQWTRLGFEPRPSFSYQDVLLHLNNGFCLSIPIFRAIRGQNDLLLPADSLQKPHFFELFSEILQSRCF